MSAFVQFLFGGLTSGSIYALAALGLTIIFNARNVINFAQGTFLMLGGMGTAVLATQGVPLFLAIPVACLGTVACGGLIYRFAIAPARDADPENVIIITIGVSLFLQGLAALVFGKNQHMVPSFSGDAPIRFAGATILPQSLWVLGSAAVLVVGVTWYFRRTLAGKAMQAVSINTQAAALVGVRPDRVVLTAFGLSAFLGAIAGAVSAPITTTSYEIGLILGLKGFVAATLGGLGNALGAVVGGLLLGLIESLIAGYGSTAYKDAVPFVLIVAILLFMPQGLFGSRVRDRV